MKHQKLVIVFIFQELIKLILDPSVNIQEAYTKGEFEIIKGVSHQKIQQLQKILRVE